MFQQQLDASVFLMHLDLNAKHSVNWAAVVTEDASKDSALVMMDLQARDVIGRNVQMIAMTMGIVEMVNACARKDIQDKIAECLRMKQCHTNA
jgi:hypothetical protein